MQIQSLSFTMSDNQLPREFVPLMTSSPKKENTIAREWIPLMTSTPKKKRNDSTMKFTAVYERDTFAGMEELSVCFSKMRIKLMNTL